VTGTDKVSITITYNGGWPRAHTVSRSFLARLREFLRRHPNFDCVITER
jgi:hypothetical protein